MSKMKSHISLLFCFALSFFLLGYVRDARAQVLYGSISGTITDQSGGAVPKAHVVITNRATGIQREVDVDENGHYAVTDLPPGDYDLKVTASGFKPLTQTGLTIAANTVANADARLEVGAMNEQVTVSGTVVKKGGVSMIYVDAVK